ncbi:MAG: hypothetical protein AAGG01_22965 [Planctomycetota bacterium]
MAFTPWPHDATLDAITFTYTEALNHGDWIAHHLDLGIPWEEALQGTAYPQAVEDELAQRVTNTPIGTPVYLALTPLNSARDAMALNWGASGAEPLSAPWDSRTLSSPEVIQAYSNYALDLIQRFQPACVNFAIEVSELALNDAALFQEFLTMETALLANLRAVHPDLPLMISVALKSPGSAAASTIAAELAPAIAPLDWLGVSVYPYVFFDHADKGDPANLPSNWLSQAEVLSGGRPIVIAETGWIAEDLVVPSFSLNVASDDARQDAFVAELFRAAESIDARLITWFTIADFDDLWNGALGQSPLAHLWRDTGLFDGVQQPRISLATWDAELAKPVD